MPQYSKEGCPVCDAYTVDKQYVGTLHERRTSDGRTIGWIDVGTGIRLSRTIDFHASTGQVFTGGEINHNDKVHAQIANSSNIIAFTVKSTGMKRYAIVQEPESPKALLLQKLRANRDMSDDGVVSEFTNGDIKLNEATDALRALSNELAPERVERIISKIVRNPKIAQLIKEGQDYICEVCGLRPFIQRNGKPYAEADHIRPLGGEYRGLDTPENMRCLCAQCHAVITYGSPAVIRQLLSTTKWGQ